MKCVRNGYFCFYSDIQSYKQIVVRSGMAFLSYIWTFENTYYKNRRELFISIVIIAIFLFAKFVDPHINAPKSSWKICHICLFAYGFCDPYSSLDNVIACSTHLLYMCVQWKKSCSNVRKACVISLT